VPIKEVRKSTKMLNLRSVILEMDVGLITTSVIKFRQDSTGHLKF